MKYAQTPALNVTDAAEKQGLASYNLPVGETPNLLNCDYSRAKEDCFQLKKDAPFEVLLGCARSDRYQCRFSLGEEIHSQYIREKARQEFEAVVEESKPTPAPTPVPVPEPKPVEPVQESSAPKVEEINPIKPQPAIEPAPSPVEPVKPAEPENVAEPAVPAVPS